MESAISNQIKNRLASASNILIVSHVRPDGDAIGSLLGLGLALQNAGKTVQMVLRDGVPGSFRHLAGSDQVRKEAQGEWDTFICVDCADYKRLGSAFESVEKPDINIDHHITNEKFKSGLTLNSDLLDAEAALLQSRWNYIQAMVDHELADALLQKSIGTEQISETN